MFKLASALTLAAAMALSSPTFADPIKHTDWWIQHHQRHAVYRAAAPVVYYAPQRSSGFFGGIGDFLGGVVDGTLGAVVGGVGAVAGGVYNAGGYVVAGAVAGEQASHGQWWHHRYYTAGTGPCWQWDAMQGWVWVCAR